MNNEQAATLLASGLKPTNVASILGCSPSAISQLQNNPEFLRIYEVKRIEAEEEDIEEKALSAKYHAAEHQLLDQVLAMAPVSELRDVTNALRVVAERQDKAKTRLNPIQAGHTVVQQVINLTIPAHTIPEVILTQEKEVQAINQLHLAPLTSEGVTNLFSAMRKEKDNDSTRIPAEAGRASPQALPAPAQQETFITKVLDSFHPAPYAESY